jgi:hypothetical protein
MKRLLAVMLCALSLPASPHVLDQYLQIAQIALEPAAARIELRLVPGAQVADRLFALMDTNNDGQLSPAEEQAYARRVLLDLALEIDGRRVPLALTGVQFPARTEMSRGEGVIRLTLAAEAPLSGGEHRLSFRNDHQPGLGVYLANVLVPANESIKVTQQKRDPLQHGLLVYFRVSPANVRL